MFLDLLHLTRSRLRERLFIHFFTHPESSRYLRELALLLRCDPAIPLTSNLKKKLRAKVYVVAGPSDPWPGSQIKKT